MKAQRELKKNPKKTIELIEKVLETEPYNPQANMLLKDAASPRIIRRLRSSRWKLCSRAIQSDVKVLHELGRLYHQYEQSDKAVEVYNRISEIAPPTWKPSSSAKTLQRAPR